MNDLSRASISRRDFLARSGAWAALAAAHTSLGAASAGAGRPVTGGTGRAGRRIVSLRLRSAAPLDAMKRFYRDTLGLEVVAEDPRSLTIAAGGTDVTFVAEPGDGAPPFYHFAFNIPEHKILAARTWQLDRTPLFDTPPRLRDPEYPNDVRHFRSWNAHSLFFFDPADNVVEYIARHDLTETRDQGTSGASFGSGDVLYASEIAFVVDDVPAAATALRERLDLGSYRGHGAQFHAVGDERGLLLVFATGRDIGHGSGKEKPCASFPTEVGVRGAPAGGMGFDTYPYRIEPA